MKKIFTILIALLAVVGVKANIISLDTHKVLQIGSAISNIDELKTGFYILSLNSNSAYVSQNQDDGLPYRVGNAPGNTSTTYVVRLIVQEDSANLVKIQLLNEKYICGVTTNNAQVTVTENEDDATIFSVHSTTTGSTAAPFFINLYSGDNVFHLNNNATNGSVMKMVDVGSSGSWSQFAIYPVSIVDEPQTTYALTTLGAPAGTTYSIDSTKLMDNSFAAYASELTDNYVTVTLPNGTTGYNVFSQTHTESDGIGTYTITFSLDITNNISLDITNNIGMKATFSNPASSVETGKWYLLYQNRNGDGYAYNNGGYYFKGASSNFATGTTLSTGNQVYLFQFIPTATEGVYYIQNADGTFFGEGSGGNISAAQTGCPYRVNKTTDSDDTYYYMQCATTNYVVDNNGNGNNVVWWGTSVPTSTSGNNVWRFYEVNFEDVSTDEAREALLTALTNANQYKDLIGTEMGKYTDPSAEGDNAFLTILAEAQTMYDNNSSTVAEYEYETTKLTPATSALRFNDRPAAGKYYRLKNKSTNGYLTSPEINETENGSTLTAITTDGTGANTIWYYDTSSENSSKEYILSYCSGKYVNIATGSANLSITFPSSNNTGTAIRLNTNVADAVQIYQPIGGWAYLYTTDNIVSGHNDSRQTAHSVTDDVYNWYVEAVTSLPVTAHQSGDGKYYATACVPVAVTVDGATAYKVTTANNTDTIAGVAVLEEIGTTVPANTPMLLIGSQENVTLNIVESDATAPTDNILSGASTATEVVNGNYYFGQDQDNGTPGFYKVSYDNTGSTRIYITNRAYLTTVGDATTSQAKGFTFVFGDDDPTGIGSATASDEILQNSVRYNLQGQRVDESYKGIVIIGGKKYLIK